MSHDPYCPDEYEARAKARRDAHADHEFYGYDMRRSPYECDEANAEYRRAYRREFEREEEERADQRRWERMREEDRQEEQWAEEQAMREAIWRSQGGPER